MARKRSANYEKSYFLAICGANAHLRNSNCKLSFTGSREIGHDVARQALSMWIFEAAEFPVGGVQNTTHIDFILRGARRSVYLVAECKRADPARANWCFVKAPYTRRSAYETELVFQEVSYRPAHLVASRHHTNSATLASCPLGFELRTSLQGDSTSGGGSAIKDATFQVLRGVNGLVDELFPGPATQVKAEGATLFLPVIFTTAALWIAEGDLSAADLATGLLPQGWGAPKNVPWLWFSHNQSPALRHQLPLSVAPDHLELPQALHAEYTRSIAVVGRDGIDTFLRTDLPSWL